jgi:cytoplasmic iron level regulating protein YaaA (DUF328/UPF0246 family)
VLTVLSPAKTLDFESPLATRKHSIPRHLADSAELVDVLAEKRPEDLAAMMGLSPELAQLNFERFQEWQTDFAPENARPALLAFKGDVYRGLDAGGRFSTRDYTYAQRHLRILSGLHGVLRPLDLIQPYRLEMGSKLQTDRGATLYEFWGDTITTMLAEDVGSTTPRVVVNLASQEYFSSVDTDKLDARVISPVFLDFSRGDYRIVSFHAKVARGDMAAWLILNRIKTIRGISAYDGLGYRYAPERSDLERPVFIRDAA